MAVSSSTSTFGEQQLQHAVTPLQITLPHPLHASPTLLQQLRMALPQQSQHASRHIFNFEHIKRKIFMTATICKTPAVAKAIWCKTNDVSVKPKNAAHPSRCEYTDAHALVAKLKET